MAITFRPGEVADGPAVYDVFVQTTIDLEQRMGLPDATILVFEGLLFVLILISETFYGRFKIFNPEKRSPV